MRFSYVVFCALLLQWTGVMFAAEPIRVLFLGDQGHHRPRDRFEQLEPVLKQRGIETTYTESMTDLNAETLNQYDGLAIYANITRIEPEQEKALLDYVSGGKGLIPIHCASYCFLNSPKYIKLVGAQFQRHGTGVFRTKPADVKHPILAGFAGFESWDETYVHHRHNEKDRIVLTYRDDGESREPWTWVRTQGKGRVFYTAWGHDQRTWSHAGFHNLIERGIRWAVGRDLGEVPAYFGPPKMTEISTDAAPFDYVEAKIPFYPAGERWGTIGEPITKMQKPLSPTDSMTHMVTPVGFQVELFAAEPKIGKPLCMNWDERGRLWLCETVDYPNEMQPEDAGRDRIRICEDTDGDGKADQFTVFAEKLSIPTSLTFAYGGVIVHQAPHTLFLRDTDGDDVADERRVLFTGWSTRDTHAGPSNLRYGLDNWYYGMIGYAGIQGEIGGERQSFRQGFYRFRLEGAVDDGPKVTQIEFLRSVNNNCWGVGFSEEGHLFGSTANGVPSVHLAIPNRYYEGVRGWSSTVLESIAEDAEFDPITENVRQVDWHGKFTAGSGHALYTARKYPRQYWNRTAFVNGPTGHLTATFEIEPNGASFRSRNAWNLLASDDGWVAPIVAEVGPDGNVWIVDWYNYIVQHNPTPTGYQTGKGNAYVTDLRDKKHGRIYRIAYRGSADSADENQTTNIQLLNSAFAAVSESPPKDERTVSALLDLLSDSNMFWRLHAQRLMVERGQQDVVPKLIELVGDESVDSIGLNPGVIHALWTLHGLGALDKFVSKATNAAVAALEHPSAGVRLNAVKVLPQDDQTVKTILDGGLLKDQHPQVRLAALLAVAEMPENTSAGKAIAAHLADSTDLRDDWLSDAITAAAAKHSLPFLYELLNTGAELSPRGSDIVQIVAEHFARSDSADGLDKILVALKSADLQTTVAVLNGLSSGWPRDRRVELSESSEAVLVELMPKLPNGAKVSLIQLANRWGSTRFAQVVQSLMESLIAVIDDDDKPDADRITAAEQLIQFRKTDDEANEEVLSQITPQTTSELAAGFLSALGQSESENTGRLIVEKLPSLTPTVRQAAVRVLLTRADWTSSLLDAVENRTLPLAELSLDQKQTLTAHPSRRIARRARQLLARGGGLPDPNRQKVLEELTPLTKETGDPVAGKEIFKKQCLKCHTHSGEGTRIGPDLTGMAVHPKAELLAQLIDPSRNVEGTYRVYTVVTEDGLVRNGLLLSETRTTIELFDSEGKKHLIQREEIEELVASAKSLMPEGFEKQITQTDLVNLLEFLTQRGRFLPLPLEKAATIVSTRGMFFEDGGRAERLIFPDWTPKEFAGVPFHLVDPRDGRVANAILLYGPQGIKPPKMPRSVSLDCNAPARSIHFLSGVSGWGFPLGERGSVSMIVRLHYADGKSEDHELKNGIHFADYIRRVDVPQSQFAFRLRNQQMRYLSIQPMRTETIERIELIKGPDRTAPVVMAVTVETP